MGRFRLRTTSAVIVAACLLAYQTGAHAVWQKSVRTPDKDDYTHLGCFMDSKDDRVMGYKLADDEMTTPDFCYEYCVGKGAPLMATQFGMECWCATGADIDYDRHGKGAQCDSPCAGDENEMCGGTDAFDLYLIESTDASRSGASSDDYTHMGCFKDNLEDRVLGNMLTDDKKTTADFCYDYCVGMDAPLMATQFGIECWCATDVKVDYERHGEGAQCNYPCAGDKSKMCGGFAAFDLYRIGSNSTRSQPDETPSEPEDTPSEPEDAPSEREETPSEQEDTPEGALNEDIVKVVEVAGDDPGGRFWADSYSVKGACYMQTTFDHDVGEIKVDTPRGVMTIRKLFDLLAPGPGSEGRPLYNDIQCGNGPPNTAADEVKCPGLVEYGRKGCGQIGPMWNLSELE